MDGRTLSLSDFIGERAIAARTAERGLRLTWLLLQKARLRRYERPDGARFETEAFRDAVLKATGRNVRDVRTRFMRHVFDAAERELRYGGLVEFNDSLAVALYIARWQPLKARLIEAYGYGDGMNGVHDGLLACIRREVADPLGFQFWDNAEEAPISSAGESLATGPYYLLASAMVGDDRGVEEMDGLAKLLARWIPVGEIKNEPGAWLAVASAI